MEDGVNPEGNSGLSLDQGAELIGAILSGEPEKRNGANPEREAGDPLEDNEATATDQVLDDKTAQDDETEGDEEGDDADDTDEDVDPDESDEDEAEDEDGEEPKTVTLKDGTEVTLDELERGYMRDADYRRKTMELAANRKELETIRTDTAQKAQLFQQQADFAIALASAYLPKKPDPSLMKSDPLGYIQAQADYEEQMGNLQQLVAAKQQAQQELQAQELEQKKERLFSERDRLVEALPELREPANLKRFTADLMEAANLYGYTPEDVNSAEDHRLLLMARDAVAYRRLMANKPKAKAKGSNVPPVQKPGRRSSPGEANARRSKEKWARLQKTGSMEDGAAVLLDLIT